MKASQSRSAGELFDAVRAMATHLPVVEVEVVSGRPFTAAEREAVEHALAAEKECVDA